MPVSEACDFILKESPTQVFPENIFTEHIWPIAPFNALNIHTMNSSNTVCIFLIHIYQAQEFVLSLCYIEKYLLWKKPTSKLVAVKFGIKTCEAVRSRVNYREKHSRMLLILTESDAIN